MTEQENRGVVTNSFKSNFSAQGTAARSQYWGTIIISWFAVGFGIVMTESGGPLVALLGLAVLVACIWCLIAVTIKRCRDAGLTPWWTVGTVIPLIGWIVAIALGVVKTSEKE